MPIYRIVFMLQQIGAGFFGEVIHDGSSGVMA
jgi:hypothetical protein